MDLKQIEKLMSAMEHSRIKRVVLKKEDFEIEIERESLTASATPPVYSPPPVMAAPALLQETHNPMVRKEAPKEEGLFVASPMVGTFYTASSPENPPFVKVGDQITEDAVVCIIEAMKVMNEVKAGVKGVVAEVLIKNGEPVEFGTRLFRVE